MPQPAPDLLYVLDRPSRPPLREWAMRARHVLQTAGLDSVHYPMATAALNNIALIFAHLGHGEIARAICHAELTWLSRRAADLGDAAAASILRLAIDPWVNCGRLDALAGSCTQACTYFSQVFRLSSDHSCVVLGPCAITAEVWRHIEEIDPRLADVVRTVYVVDSIKAHLFVGDYDGALGFIDTLEWADNSALRWLIDEARVIAWTGLGRYHDALSAVHARQPGVDPYYVAVMALHSIGSHLALGSDNTARVLAADLARLLQDDVFGAAIPPASVLRFTAKLASVLERLDERVLALSIYEEGLALARQLPDQPCEWSFGRALLRHGAELPSPPDVAGSYKRLVVSSDYSSIRRAEGLAPIEPSSASVYSQLLELVSVVTGGTIEWTSGC